MFYYKRKTSFIEYYINGIKSRCIGIVKQKVTEEGLWCLIELSGLEEWKTMLCKVSVGDAKNRQEVMTIRVEEGICRQEFEIPLKEIKAEQCKKMVISFGNDCYGIADLCELPSLKMADAEAESKRFMEEEKDYDITVTRSADKSTEAELEEIRETCPIEINEGRNEGNVNNEGTREVHNKVTGMENSDKDEELAGEKDGISEVLCDCLAPQPDKWEVIKKKYPILYPFRGQGPYVSIKPVDLQLLDEKYHKLSDNSFLMHAFCQYRHMILGEYEQDGSAHFYVGVPGEFVKKEQESAAMFGFEGYEHSGDLGYYLYRVDL